MGISTLDKNSVYIQRALAGAEATGFAMYDWNDWLIKYKQSTEAHHTGISQQ